MERITLAPIGSVVREVSLRAPTPELIADLPGLLADHGVVVFPEQELDDQEFIAFLRRFGELMFSDGETPVRDAPDLNLISNVGRSTPPRSVFHVDTSYVRRPPAYTALRAVTIPRQGGQTLFTNQYRAFDTLPPTLRDLLQDRVITHRMTGLTPGPDAEVEAEHPAFRPHPITGRISVYVSTPQRCVAVSGLRDDDATRAVAELYAHSITPDNTYRHAWAPGDVVMWDNSVVLHRADHDGVEGDRVMHRGMVADYPERPSRPPVAA